MKNADWSHSMPYAFDACGALFDVHAAIDGTASRSPLMPAASTAEAASAARRSTGWRCAAR
jgi:hypothetical protein